MSQDIEVMRMLGQIDGKLDQVIATAAEHREDDVRRFTDVYKRLDDHEKDINQAKGAKGAILWAAGVVAALATTVVTMVGKKMGIL